MQHDGLPGTCLHLHDAPQDVLPAAEYQHLPSQPSLTPPWTQPTLRHVEEKSMKHCQRKTCTIAVLLISQHCQMCSGHAMHCSRPYRRARSRTHLSASLRLRLLTPRH
jgi:hypothetical protein